MAHKTLHLDETAAHAIAMMVYARWSDAFTRMKEVKALTWEGMKKFCPRADWPDYHEAMIKSAQAELDLADKLKREVCLPLMQA